LDKGSFTARRNLAALTLQSAITPPGMWCSPDWKELNLDPKRVHVEKEVEIRLRSVVAEVSRR